MEGCLTGPGAQDVEIEENPSRRPRPWKEYVLTLSNLQSYMSMITGRNDLRVIKGDQSGHVGHGTVQLPVGTLEAGETAAHEAGHIMDPGAADAWRFVHYQGKAQEMVYVFLRDGAVEYAMGTESPGLHVQWQYSNDDATDDLLGTEWIPQSLYGIYLLVGGYDFPEHQFKPKARKLLAEFRSLGYIDEARSVSANVCARDLVPKVIALFNVQTPPPPPDGGCKYPNGGTKSNDPNGGQETGEGEGEGEGKEGQGKDGQGQGQGSGSGQGSDERTKGGVDSNSLLNNATRAANKIQKIENAKEERAREAAEEVDDSPGYRPVPKGGGEARDARGNVPKPLRDVGDMKEGQTKQNMAGEELSKIFGGKGGGGTGYSVELAYNVTIVDRSRG